jgi:hypothetical protein
VPVTSSFIRLIFLSLFELHVLLSVQPW